MQFITQGKTNWKFLVITMIIAVVAGGMILAYSVKKDISFTENQSSVPTENIKKIASDLMIDYLDQYKCQGSDTENCIKNYVINEIKIDMAKDECLGFSVNFSVERSSNAYDWSWTAGNGEVEGNWVKNKYVFMDVIKENGNYKIREMGTGRAYQNCMGSKEIINNSEDGWLVYKNEEMGFEIKYPNDLTVSNHIVSTASYVNFSKNNEVVFTVWMGGRYDQISQKWLTLEENISIYYSLGSLREGESRKNIKFGAENYDGIRIDAYKSVGVIKLIPRVFAKDINSTNILEITGHIPTNSSDLPEGYDTYELFDQMLSTFKFIESNETTGWQTYRNEDYGIELEYPESMLLYPSLKINPVEYDSDGHKYSGIRLGEFNNGCSLNIFKIAKSDNINPFDETNIPVLERQYTTSKNIELNNNVYYLGMSVTSHAVDPDRCQILLDEIVSTFQLI